MIAAISLAVITAALWWLAFREVRRQREALRRHAAREAIRQGQQMHPWERGDLPEAGQRVDRALARRIARGRTGTRVLPFKTGSDR